MVINNSRLNPRVLAAQTNKKNAKKNHARRTKSKKSGIL